jgi:hypothetical protein
MQPSTPGEAPSARVLYAHRMLDVNPGSYQGPGFRRAGKDLK